MFSLFLFPSDTPHVLTFHKLRMPVITCTLKSITAKWRTIVSLHLDLGTLYDLDITLWT